MSLTDFVMLSKVGEGSFSSVHKVKRISDGNIYALKKVPLQNDAGEAFRSKIKRKRKCTK